MTGNTPLSAGCATLPDTGRKARYGVAYLRSVCAQAGVGMTETSPDEDVLATDCSVEFTEAPVRVQVKCSSQFKLSGATATWPLEDGWIRSWAGIRVPVYFVLVLVGTDIAEWLEHPSDGTLHRTAAFWRRIDTTVLGSSIQVDKKNRLTAGTLDEWHQDLLGQFTGSTP